MSTIVTRTGKGSPLTFAEMDANLTNLNTDKLEAADLHAATAKTTPANSDEIPLLDSASSFSLKKLLWSDLVTALTSLFAPVTSGTSILKGDGSGGFSNAAAGTDYQAPIGTHTGVVKGNGANAITAATAGTDYAKPDTASNWSGVQRSSPTTDNDLSFDLTAANNWTCTPTAGGALTFTNIASATGESGFIKLVNGSNYAITAGTNTKVTTTFLTTISATGTYIISYYCDGTSVFCATAGAMA